MSHIEVDGIVFFKYDGLVLCAHRHLTLQDEIDQLHPGLHVLRPAAGQEVGQAQGIVHRIAGFLVVQPEGPHIKMASNRILKGVCQSNNFHVIFSFCYFNGFRPRISLA